LPRHAGSPSVASMTLDLQHMSRDQKLRVMHEIWEDLAREDDATASPEWHKTALEETQSRAEQGIEAIHRWEDAKTELLRRAS
jgi:hypothetical protein